MIRSHGVVVDFNETMTVVLGRLNFIETFTRDNCPRHFFAAYGQGDIAVLVTAQSSTPYLCLVALDFRFIEFERLCSGLEEIQSHGGLVFFSSGAQGIKRSRIERHGSMLSYPSLGHLRGRKGLGNRGRNVAWGFNEEWGLRWCRGADSNSGHAQRCRAQAQNHGV